MSQTFFISMSFVGTILWFIAMESCFISRKGSVFAVDARESVLRVHRAQRIEQRCLRNCAKVPSYTHHTITAFLGMKQLSMTSKIWCSAKKENKDEEKYGWH